MILDLRIPMGLMFSITGFILTVFGLVTQGNVELYARSMGINANLWWGLVLLAFGLTMYLTGRRAQKQIEKNPPPPAEEGSVRRGH
jgi:hypothetical protein